MTEFETATSNCVSTGSPSLPRETSSLWKGLNTSSSNPAQDQLVSGVRPAHKVSSPRSGNQRVSGLVVTPKSHNPGCSPGAIASRVLSVLRQQPQGLWCPCVRSYNVGHMVRCLCTTPHKCPRAEGNLARSDGILRQAGQLHCCDHVRQHVCHCVCEKSGGHKIVRNEMNLATQLCLWVEQH